MEDSAKKVEEEISRALEQAKELRDAASSSISRSSAEEQALRQRAISLESNIRRLRSLLDSISSNKLLDPNLAEKACK